MDFNIDELIEKAFAARINAYAFYSKFKVGCAILLKNGKYILGCNIENSSYSLSMCAERVALFKLISEGYTKADIKAIGVIADSKNPISPCGACRQVFLEFLDLDTPIILSNLKRDKKVTNLSELYPYPFDLNEVK